MTVARVIRIVFGAVAGLMLVAALGDVLLSGHLTIISPASFGALLAVALAFLISQPARLARAQRHADAPGGRVARPSAQRLEASLRNAAAMNARLNQSEARYKGLVDAQGDAIFRRDAASRLTYGNDAFFKLFGLDPARAIGYPFAPELHPESRAPLFGSFAALETGPRPRPLRPACAHRPGLALDRLGRLSRCAIPMAGWSKCKASAATSPSARRWKTR